MASLIFALRTEKERIVRSTCCANRDPKSNRFGTSNPPSKTYLYAPFRRAPGRGDRDRRHTNGGAGARHGSRSAGAKNFLGISRLLHAPDPLFSACLEH